MAARTEPRPPRRSVSILLALVILVVAGGGAVFYAGQTLDRLRVDTPVQAVAQGEPGCVNAATFTGPDGVVRRVDVTVYKGACQDLDPGDAMTVYYDAGDPAVTATSQAWWWSALVVLVGLSLVAVAGRGLALNVAALLRERREPGSARLST